jgi:hypothetical protein
MDALDQTLILRVMLMKNVCRMSLVIAALCASASAASAQTPSGGDLLANQGRFAVLNQLNGETVLDR